MDIYQTPQSTLAENGGSRTLIGDWRPKWFLILAFLFIAWKTYDYLVLYWWGLVNSPDLIGMLLYSINLPVYISAFLFIFYIRIPPRLMWRIWIPIAIFDESRMLVIYYEGIFDLLQSIVIYVPLHGLGILYAYGSPNLWANNES